MSSTEQTPTTGVESLPKADESVSKKHAHLDFWHDDGSATCRNCGHHWNREPVLEIDCPKCDAKAGELCTLGDGSVLVLSNSASPRISGHNMGTFTPKTGICEEREVEALKQGILEPCHHGEYPPQEYIDRFDFD